MTRPFITLNPAPADALIALRDRGMNYDACAEVMGVSRKVLARWCLELGVNLNAKRSRVVGRVVYKRTPRSRRHKS